MATVAYIRDALQKSDTAFALMIAALGLGSTVASILLRRATGRYEQGAEAKAVLTVGGTPRHRACSSGAALCSARSFFGISRSAALYFRHPPAYKGARQALIAIPFSTLLAEHIDETERGRACVAHFALTYAC